MGKIQEKNVTVYFRTGNLISAKISSTVWIYSSRAIE